MIGAIGFGQIDLLVATLVVVDLTSGRQAPWGGLLVGAAAALKLTPLIFIPYLLASRRSAMAARALGDFGLSIVISFLLVPGDAHAYWPLGAFDTSPGSPAAATTPDGGRPTSLCTGSCCDSAGDGPISPPRG